MLYAILNMSTQSLDRAIQLWFLVNRPGLDIRSTWTYLLICLNFIKHCWKCQKFNDSFLFWKWMPTRIINTHISNEIIWNIHSTAYPTTQTDFKNIESWFLFFSEEIKMYTFSLRWLTLNALIYNAIANIFLMSSCWGNVKKKNLQMLQLF